MPVITLALLLWLVPQTPVPSPTPQAPTLAAAQALFGSGDAAGAKAMLERIVETAPSDARAWTMLGNVCLSPRSTDADCAIAALSKVLALRPNDPQALLSIGVAHAAKGDAETAFRFLGQARSSRRIDMTQLSINPLVEPLRKDPRYAALMPVPADFANPFVEATTIVREWSGEGPGDGFGWIASAMWTATACRTSSRHRRRSAPAAPTAAGCTCIRRRAAGGSGPPTATPAIASASASKPQAM